MNREKHYATVLNNLDNESEEIGDGLMRGRLQVQCDTLLIADDTGADTEFALWVEPSFPFTGVEGKSGWFFVPPIGAQVEIEIDRDEIGAVQSVKWIAGIYTDLNDIPEQFKTNYPERRGMITPAGHTLFFDDTSGSELMTLSSPTGQYINFGSAGEIIISIITGSLILIDKVNKSVIVADENGNLFQLNENGIKIVDKNGSFIETARDKIQIVSSADLVVSGNNVDISGGTVNLGDPNGLAFGAMLGDLMVALFDAHTHLCTAPGSPSGPPVIPIASLNGSPAYPVAMYIKHKVGGYF